MMESSWFNIFGIAGVGGLALLAAVFVFNKIVQKNIFPILSKDHSYALLNRIVVCIFILAILGILTYLGISIANTQNGKNINLVNTNNSQLPAPTIKLDNSTNTALNPITPIGINKNSNIVTNTLPTQTPVASINNNAQPTPTSILSNLSGIVTDADGIGLQEAKVEIVELPKMKAVTTSSDGQFDLENIPKDYGETIRLRITLDGYESFTRDVVIGARQLPIRLKKKTL